MFSHHGSLTASLKNQIKSLSPAHKKHVDCGILNEIKKIKARMGEHRTFQNNSLKKNLSRSHILRDQSNEKSLSKSNLKKLKNNSMLVVGSYKFQEKKKISSENSISIKPNVSAILCDFKKNVTRQLNAKNSQPEAQENFSKLAKLRFQLNTSDIEVSRTASEKSINHKYNFPDSGSNTARLREKTEPCEAQNFQAAKEVANLNTPQAINKSLLKRAALRIDFASCSTPRNFMSNKKFTINPSSSKNKQDLAQKSGDEIVQKSNFALQSTLGRLLTPNRQFLLTQFKNKGSIANNNKNACSEKENLRKITFSTMTPSSPKEGFSTGSSSTKAKQNKKNNLNNMQKIIEFLSNDEKLKIKKDLLNKQIRNFRRQEDSKSNTPKQLSHAVAELSDYCFDRVLGSGAFAIVYLATEKSTRKKVAIKTYEKLKLLDPNKLKNIQKEIDNLSLFNHSNIISLLSVIDTVKNIHLVMEYPSSNTLYDYLNIQPRRKFAEAEAKHIFIQLAEAVAHIHSKNVVHRDLKLDNILISDKKIVKIIDFGFSMKISPDQKISYFCGTTYYMSPEIVSHSLHSGYSSDVWSLGIILFKIVTGEFPFESQKDNEVYNKIKFHSIKYPNYLSKELKHLFEKLLAPKELNRIKACDIKKHIWFEEPNNQSNKY